MIDFRQLDGNDAKEKDAWETVTKIAKETKELDELYKLCTQHVKNVNSWRAASIWPTSTHIISTDYDISASPLGNIFDFSSSEYILRPIMNYNISDRKKSDY